MTIAARTVDNGSGTDYDVLVDNITADSVAGDAQVISGPETIDDPILGRPVLIAGRASTAPPSTMSADGDVQTPWLTREGAQVVAPNIVELGPFTPTIDTAVYADGDRLGSVVTLTNMALRNGGSGMIVGGRLVDDAASNFSVELWLFGASPTMVGADNAAFDITDANIATAVYKGTLDFWSANTKLVSTSNRVTQATWLGGVPAMPYTCESSTTSLYGILKARGAYDAAATDDLVYYLHVVRF